MTFIKQLLKSRTVIVAILQAVAGAVLILNAEYPTIGILMTVKSVVDVILRVITSLPIKFK